MDLKRVKFFRNVLILVVGIISLRLFYIQIIQHEEWVAKAEEQHTLENTITAKRGEIYMMDGEEPVEVVMNETVYAIVIDPMVVNREKLPRGIKGLAEDINALGLKFGLWFEPEMVSPDSDLYRAHPDWCLHAEGRRRSESRNQLILDMSRRDVQDYVIEAVSAVLRSAPIDYVKWDMNRNFKEAGSVLLADGRQGEIAHRYMLGLYRVLEMSPPSSPTFCLKAALAAADGLTPVCCITCPRPGPATIPTPWSACSSSTAPACAILPAPWGPMCPPCPIIRRAA